MTPEQIFHPRTTFHNSSPFVWESVFCVSNIFTHVFDGLKVCLLPWQLHNINPLNHGAARSVCLESLSCWNIYDGIPLWNNETWPFHVFVFILHHDPCYVQKQAQHNSISKSPSSQCIQQCALCLHSGWWFDLCCLKLSIYVPFIRLIIWICVTIHLNKIDCYCCVISLKQIPDPIQVILIDFITETYEGILVSSVTFDGRSPLHKTSTIKALNWPTYRPLLVCLAFV